jgi:hypothetical protein
VGMHDAGIVCSLFLDLRFLCLNVKSFFFFFFQTLINKIKLQISILICNLFVLNPY